MNGLSVIIPSKNIANLRPCVEAVRKHESFARIIVVDDGLAEKPEGCEVIPGVKPFVYARNCNLGIKAAGADDVVLLNDDAILESELGFGIMQEILYSQQEIAWIQGTPQLGIIASTCNNVGNVNQRPRRFTDTVRYDPRMVCFVCVLIPRYTIDTVGLLDEDYVGYGMDDDDYCLRVRQAGLKIGITDKCYVDHGKLESSYRGGPKDGGDFRPNLRVFIRKHGVDNWGKTKEQSQYPECFE